MRRLSTFAVLTLALLALLAMLSGCRKKKPPLPPPQEQAPNIALHPAPAPPEVLPPPPPPPAAETAPATVNKPKPKPKKPVAKTTTPPKPEKKSVTDGGATSTGGQLAADLPQGEATQQRQATTQLLASAESNLRGITRTLSSDEQAMVQQVRAYMQQSRAAAADGDTERAYNLALKARLLSAELARTR